MRILRGAAAAAVALVLLFFGGGGWFYAGEIRSGALDSAPPAQPDLDIPVLAVDAGSVTLARAADAPPELVTDGVFGLQGSDGYGQVGAVTAVEDDRVVRAYTPVDGAPVEVGDWVGIDAFAYPGDPAMALGVPFEEVTYTSELGATPAWLVPGDRPTWVLFVHGYNASPREALRLVGPVAARGYPALVLSYRNDPDAPRTADGLRRWGQEEWRDVEAAGAYALEHGARELVLVGYSMGGAVVTSFLYESDLADRVAGVVLDSPALDLGAVVDEGARDRTLPVLGMPIPSPLTAVAKVLAEVRYDVDFEVLDYVARAERLSAPVLLFHGEEDLTVPVAIGERLAAARPDLVTFVRASGTGHVQAWNTDRAGYEQEVTAFLDRVACC